MKPILALRHRSLVRPVISSLAALAATIAIFAFSSPRLIGQEKKGKGGGGGGGPQLYGPYYSPPVIPGGPVSRLPDGHPDIQGYYATRFNNSVFNIEDTGKQKGS